MIADTLFPSLPTTAFKSGVASAGLWSTREPSLSLTIVVVVSISKLQKKNQPKIISICDFVHWSNTIASTIVVKISFLKMDFFSLQKHNSIMALIFKKIHSKIWACACVASSQWVQSLYEVRIFLLSPLQEIISKSRHQRWVRKYIVYKRYKK